MEGTSQNAYDQYWRYPKYRLVSSAISDEKAEEILSMPGFNLPGRVTFTELATTQRRIDRGLILYEQCSIEELTNFTRDRNLVKQLGENRKRSFLERRLKRVPGLRRTIASRNHDHAELEALAKGAGYNIQNISRDFMISALNFKDEQAKFKRFQDLPPELRACVYDFYIADSPEVLRAPTTPPLARTNKVIRAEILPIFFRTRTFELDYIDRRPKFRRSYTLYDRSYALDTDTRLWLLYMQPDMVRHLRRLDVRLWDKAQDGELQVCFNLRLGENVVGATVEAEVPEVPVLKVVSGNHKPFAEAAVQLLQKIWSKTDGVTGVRKFEVGDIHELRRALEKAGQREKGKKGRK